MHCVYIIPSNNSFYPYHSRSFESTKQKLDNLLKCDTDNNSFYLFIYFFRNKHTQGKEKGVLTQKYTSTPLKRYGNF